MRVASRGADRLNAASAAPAARLWSDAFASADARRLLDALRGAAALLVFAAHAAFFWLDAHPSTTLPARLLHAADLAVIVFFVVSGCVIVASMRRRAAATADGRLGLARFARDRARRLLPPLALAVVVTTLCHAYLLAAGSPGYAPYWSAELTLGVALFLQGLVEPFDVPLANGALWSLSHEGWFYVVGAALFARRPPLLVAGAVLVVALAGAATLGLVPEPPGGDRAGRWLPGFVVWCAGGALAFGGGLLPMFGGRAFAPVVLVLSALLVVTALADTFAARYAFGLVLAALLAVLLPELASTRVWRLRVVRLTVTSFAAVAPFSYTLYVLHYPLVLAWNVATESWQRSLGGTLATITLGGIGIVSLCAVVGPRIERIGRAPRAPDAT